MTNDPRRRLLIVSKNLVSYARGTLPALEVARVILAELDTLEPKPVTFTSRTVDDVPIQIQCTTQADPITTAIRALLTMLISGSESRAIAENARRALEVFERATGGREDTLVQNPRPTADLATEILPTPTLNHPGNDDKDTFQTELLTALAKMFANQWHYGHIGQAENIIRMATDAGLVERDGFIRIELTELGRAALQIADLTPATHSASTRTEMGIPPKG